MRRNAGGTGGATRVVLAAASALVLLVTGAGYGLYADVAAAITTTDVIAGGGGREQNVLLVGIDSRTDALGGPLPPSVLRDLHAGPETGVLNTDAIMLVHLPSGRGSAVAFSIPRDAYVDIPGHGSDKINAAYPAARAEALSALHAEGERDRPLVEAEAARRGRKALIGAVEDLTGLHVDHYAEVNLAGFVALADAVGGVQVCLNAAVAEPLSGARFPAGRQTISGAAALAFVRQRHDLPQGDLSRVRRQQAFLAAVASKLRSAGTLSDPVALGRLIDAARRSLVVDEGWDLLGFARQASRIESVQFTTVPTRGGETNARGDVVLVDAAEVAQFVQLRLADPIPLPGRGPAAGAAGPVPGAVAGATGPGTVAGTAGPGTIAAATGPGAGGVDACVD